MLFIATCMSKKFVLISNKMVVNYMQTKSGQLTNCPLSI